ncbi:MAG: hypothetical protein GY882_01205 [Actinomycetia bacterium]|nr:hypothetical protein [Actinomycetes bacterium]
MAEQVRPMQYQEEERFKFDPYAHAVTAITEPHRMTHDGFMYNASSGGIAVADGATLDVIFALAAGVFAHVILVEFGIDDGPGLVELYENVVTSDDGTTVLTKNHNRVGTPSDPATVVTHTPTITDVGDVLHQRYIPDPGGSGNQSLGNVFSGEDQEWVLGGENKYLWRLTNNSGGAINAGVHFNFYEIGYTVNHREEFDNLSGS